ncbi:MAG: hypothetical protein AAF591_07275 [Verrucomicrobiota bacterium]
MSDDEIITQLKKKLLDLDAVLWEIKGCNDAKHQAELVQEARKIICWILKRIGSQFEKLAVRLIEQLPEGTKQTQETLKQALKSQGYLREIFGSRESYLDYIRSVLSFHVGSEERKAEIIEDQLRYFDLLYDSLMDTQLSADELTVHFRHFHTAICPPPPGGGPGFDPSSIAAWVELATAIITLITLGGEKIDVFCEGQELNWNPDGDRHQVALITGFLVPAGAARLGEEEEVQTVAEPGEINLIGGEWNALNLDYLLQQEIKRQQNEGGGNQGESGGALQV